MRSELTLALIRRCPCILYEEGFNVDPDLWSPLSSPQLWPLAPLSSLPIPVWSRRLSALTVHFRANSIASPVLLPHDDAEWSSFLILSKIKLSINSSNDYQWFSLYQVLNGFLFLKFKRLFDFLHNRQSADT